MSVERDLSVGFYPTTDLVAQDQYREWPTWSNARREFANKYSTPPINTYQQIYEASNLEGSEYVLDLAAGDGIMSRSLFANRHGGEVVGADASPSTIEYAKYNKELAPYIIAGRLSLLACDARNLALVDHSFDAVFFNFGVYHMEHPGLAISEIKRVLKPGGKLVVATAGPDHLKKAYDFANPVAEELGVIDPGSPYYTCDFNKTRALIKQVFTKDEGYSIKLKRPKTRLILPKPLQNAETAWEDYYWVMISLCVTMRSKITGKQELRYDDPELKTAIDQIVKPVFLDEIRKNGYFEESRDRGWFIIEKVS